MQRDRYLSLLCVSAIGLCLVAAGAMTYVLATDPTRDLQPQQERAVLIGRERSAQMPQLPLLVDQLSKVMQPAGVTR